MAELVAIAFYCLVALPQSDGTTVMERCLSVDPTHEAAFLAEPIGESTFLPGGEICKVIVYGTLVTSWPEPVAAYVPCIYLK